MRTTSNVSSKGLQISGGNSHHNKAALLAARFDSIRGQPARLWPWRGRAARVAETSPPGLRVREVATSPAARPAAQDADNGDEPCSRAPVWLRGPSPIRGDQTPL